MRERGGTDAREHVTLGIALGVAAYCLLTAQDAINKLLVSHVPVWEALFFRSAFILAGCGVIGRRRLLARTAETPLKGALAIRGAVTLLAWLAYFTAARTLPFPQLTTLYFGAPILVTVLAAPLLREQVTAARWFSVCLGFVGVMIAADPGGVSASLATLLVITAAALWAYAVILMRQIARQEGALLQMATQNLVFVAGTGLLCAVDLVVPGRSELLLLVAVALCGGLGQFLLLEAARHAPASVIATVEYSSLLWAFLLGFAIWGDIPPAPVFAGAALIILSGALLVVIERRSGRGRRA